MLFAVRVVHVLSALLFFGGLLPVVCLPGVVRRQTHPAARLAGLKLLGSANRRFMLPGSILSGLSGFALSGLKALSLGAHAWLLASVALWALAMVGGMAVLAPHSRRMVRAAEAAVQTGSLAECDALADAAVPRVTRLVIGFAGLAIAALMLVRP